MNTIANQIKHEADKTMRELEQSGLAHFQIDRLSGKVNGLMLAYEIAQTAQRELLTSESVYAAIAHGDEDHRAWLRAALVAIWAGGKVPEICENKPAQTAQREPLTDGKIADMLEKANRLIDLKDYTRAVQDAEAAHGITKGAP